MLKSVARQGCVAVPQGSQAAAAVDGECKGLTETCGRASSA